MTIELIAVTEDLLQVYRAIRRLVDELAGARGMTPSQLMALRHVAQAPGCSMQALAAQLSVSRAAVTSIVDRLEAEGLVRRHAATDRRSFRLRLTARGEEVIASLRQELQARIREWVGDLPEDRAHALASGLAALSERAHA